MTWRQCALAIWPVVSVTVAALYFAIRAREKRCPVDRAQAEIDQLTAQFELPAARWRCAYCGDRITGAGLVWTGPVPEPGEDPNTVPRFHLDRPECRLAAEAEADARRGTP
ncbi:hypothetical protein AB4225_06240 [Streptomyces sp. 2RAF24]|uniref:hypothetical protein n=1 Tax=Streptomyces sp. 2RAF24 TaxID=3232997 RepID=UPI003F99AF26